MPRRISRLGETTLRRSFMTNAYSPAIYVAPRRRRCSGIMHRSCTTLMPARADRKSTRLNSSHLVISYAVFCLKKKKTITHTPSQRDDYRPQGVRTPDHFTREFQHLGHIGLDYILALIFLLAECMTRHITHPFS